MKEEQPVPSEQNPVVSSTGYSAETWALLHTLSLTLTAEAGRASCEKTNKVLALLEPRSHLGFLSYPHSKPP